MRKIEQKSKLQEHRLLKLHKASKNGLFKANERGDITLWLNLTQKEASKKIIFCFIFDVYLKKIIFAKSLLPKTIIMQKKLKLAVIALCYTPLLHAQSDSIGQRGAVLSESAFTFTEAQLGEDDDMSKT